jgi:hypothetical protein
LDAIEQDSALEGIPVITLSTTGEEPELLPAYPVRSNGHAGSPMDLERFAKIVESIGLWFALGQPDRKGYWGGLAAWNGRVN